MTMRMRRVVAVMFAGAAFAVGAVALSAQDARSYTWYGELAQVDQAAKTITVKAQLLARVSRSVSGYKPGDKLVLVWRPVDGESDTVMYAPTFEVMKTIESGFILPVEFVSSDTAGGTITFKTPVPDGVLQGLGAGKPGSWIKVTTPMRQGKAVAVLTTAVASAKPDLKPPAPEAPPAESASAASSGDGQPEPAAVPTGPGVPGAWQLFLTLRGNASGAECIFQVEETKLTGDCGGNSVAGEVVGKQLTFKYSMSLAGAPFELAFEGTLDEAGTRITGTMHDTAANNRFEFSATKK